MNNAIFVVVYDIVYFLLLFFRFPHQNYLLSMIGVGIQFKFFLRMRKGLYTHVCRYKHTIVDYFYKLITCRFKTKAINIKYSIQSSFSNVYQQLIV